MTIDDLKSGENVDSIGSLLSLNVNNRTTLNVILDVLIDIHLDGKSSEYQEKYLDKINEKFDTYSKHSMELLIPAAKK
jgi:hypothetical protein